MVIAVPYANGHVNQHFGQTQAFLIAQAGDGGLVESAVRRVDGLQHDHGGLAGFLRGENVEVVLAGGMGAPMQQALKAAGFQLYCGVSGRATDAVDAFLRGDIEQSDATCGHH